MARRISGYLIASSWRHDRPHGEELRAMLIGLGGEILDDASG
jgi:hypothetical protein